MTLEREGCFPKPCLGCCILNDACKDGMSMYAGPPSEVAPGSVAVTDMTFAYATQPKCGGYNTPSVNIFSRTTAGDQESGFVPLAKVEIAPFSCVWDRIAAKVHGVQFVGVIII